MLIAEPASDKRAASASERPHSARTTMVVLKVRLTQPRSPSKRYRKQASVSSSADRESAAECAGTADVKVRHRHIVTGR
jgi:hypothetical protein